MHVYQEKRSENKEISYSRTGITPAQPHKAGRAAPNLRRAGVQGPTAREGQRRVGTCEVEGKSSAGWGNISDAALYPKCLGGGEPKPA